MQYEKVDVQDYVLGQLEKADKGENIDKEYVAFENPIEIQEYNLKLKSDLITGTYKLVFKLYDGNIYVGEDYEYIVIK